MKSHISSPTSRKFYEFLILQRKTKTRDNLPLDLYSYEVDLFHPVVSNCLDILLVMSGIRILRILLDRDPFVIQH